MELTSLSQHVFLFGKVPQAQRSLDGRTRDLLLLPP